MIIWQWPCVRGRLRYFICEAASSTTHASQYNPPELHSLASGRRNGSTAVRMALSHGPVTSGGVTTSFLPLSTPWPLKVECSSLFVSHSQSSGLYAFDPAYPLQNSIQCLPPEATAWWDLSSGATQTTLGGYSMACPRPTQLQRLVR